MSGREVIKILSVNSQIKQYLISYSFILPYMIFAILFSFIPIIVVVLLSFFDGTLLNLASLKFVGLQNYMKLFANAEIYFGGFRNSFFYVIVILPATQIIALALALLLRRKNKASATFETILFIPLIISGAAAAIILAYVLMKTGPLNYVLSLLHLGPINWFGDPVRAKLAVSILEIWKSVPFYMFIYIAALRGIPSDYLDAAKIDGCNRWQEIWSISIPLVKNAILLCVVLKTIVLFQIFDSIVILTRGGPLRGSESVVYSIYKITLLENKIGQGAALSILFFIIILCVSFLQMRFFRSDTQY